MGALIKGRWSLALKAEAIGCDVSKPAAIHSNVAFGQPDGPSSATNSRL
jgi:hypothetical protein